MPVHDTQDESGQRLAVDGDIWRRVEDAPDRILRSRVPLLYIGRLREQIVN